MKRPNSARAFAALITLVMLLLPAVASASGALVFRLQYPTAPNDSSRAPWHYPPFAHWDLREFDHCRVPWAISKGAVPDLDGIGGDNTAADRDSFQNVIHQALEVWRDVNPGEVWFLKADAGAPATVAFAHDKWNLMFWTTTLPPDVLALTAVWYTGAGIGSGVIDESDIAFNSSTTEDPILGIHHWVIKPQGYACQADVDFLPTHNFPGPEDKDTNHNGKRDTEVDLFTVALHECGHFIGLDHIQPLGGHFNEVGNTIMEQYWLIAAGHGANDGGQANHTLSNADRDGKNFLYCPDLGDAPDPCPWIGKSNMYPTLIHLKTGRTLNGIVLKGKGKGAEHVLGIKQIQDSRMWTYEYLAKKDNGDVDEECDANVIDLDPWDDGIDWVPEVPVWGGKVTFTAYARLARDASGHAHDYPVHKLFINGWMDEDQDCIFDHFWTDNYDKKPPPGINTIVLHKFTKEKTLPQVPRPALPVWMRFRLDYGENSTAGVDQTLAGEEGAAQFGEVEDYKLYCTTEYDTQEPKNHSSYPASGIAMAYVGEPDASDVVVSQSVSGVCPTLNNPPPVITYVPPINETVYDCPVTTGVPPGGSGETGKCRPKDPPPAPPKAPQDKARTYFVTPQFPALMPRELVPAELRIPSVICGTNFPEVTNPGTVHITVGAVDAANGGWLEGPDTLTGAWDDTLRVTVGYRISPNLIPVGNLNPCDPLYTTLPLHPVGAGTVTPQDGFHFDLNVPTDVAIGSYIILEVHSAWSTNANQNDELVEFDSAVGIASGVASKPVLPTQLDIVNFPNPFNPATTIRYSLPAPARVTLAVYDVGGHVVRTLVDDVKTPAGIHEAQWDGRDNLDRPVASGVYFYRLSTEHDVRTRKAVLLK